MAKNYLSRGFFSVLLCLSLLQNSVADYCVEGDFFFLDFAPDTYDNQVTNCQNRGGIIASFESLIQFNILESLLEQQIVTDNFWVGIQHAQRGVDVSSSPNDFVYTASVAGDVTNFFATVDVGVDPWLANEPNGLVGEFQQCVAIGSVAGSPFGLFDTNCNDFRPAVCRVPGACTDSDRSFGVSCVEENGSRDLYMVTGFTEDAGTAFFFCSEFFSATPFFFDSFEGFQLLTKFDERFPGNDYWTDISMTSPGIPSTARYENNPPTDFLTNFVNPGDSPPWAIGEPSTQTNVIVNSFNELVAVNQFEIHTVGCRLRNAQTCFNIDPQFTDIVVPAPPPPPFESFCLFEHEFLVVEAQATFAEAANVCSQTVPGGQFTGFNNIEEFIRVTSFTFLPEAGEFPILVGYINTQPGSGFPGDYVSDDGNFVADNFIQTTQFGNFPWDISEPINDCVVVQSGLLRTVSCDFVADRVLCQLPASAACQFQSVCVGTQEYFLTQTPKQARDGDRFGDSFECGAFGGEARQATFGDIDDFNQLTSFFPNDSGWVGYATFPEPSTDPSAYVAFGAFTVNHATFLQGTQAGISPWGASQPDATDVCVVLDNGELRSASCFEDNQYFCIRQFSSKCVSNTACAGTTELLLGEERYTFADAEALCNIVFGSGLFFDSEQDVSDAAALAAASSEGLVWTSYLIDANDPVTISQGSGDLSFIQGTSPNVFPWNVNEPDNAAPECISLSDSLNTEACNNTHVPICAIQNSAVCDQGTEPPTQEPQPQRQFCFAENSMHLFFSFADFDSGEFICDDFGLFFDGVESLPELSKVVENLINFAPEFQINVETTGVWVGFRSSGDGSDSSEFASVTGNSVATGFVSNLANGQFPWAAGQPSGIDTCVRLFQGSLEVAPCSSPNLILCASRNDGFCSGRTACNGNTQTRLLPSAENFNDAQARCEEFGENSASFAFSSAAEFLTATSQLDTLKDFFGLQGVDVWTGYSTGESSNFPPDFSHVSPILKRTNEFIQSLGNGEFPFAEGEPSLGENCIAVDGNNNLVTRNCNFGQFVVCTKQYAQECAAQRFCTDNGVEFLYFSDEFDASTHSVNCRDLLGPSSASAAVMDSITEFEQVRDAFSFLGVPAWTNYEIFSSDASDAFDRGESSFFLSTTTNNQFPWAFNEPNVTLRTECLDFGADLTTQDCTEEKPGICRINDSPFCFEPQPDSRCLNGVTYTFDPKRLSFNDAQADCVSRGGNLVTPSSLVEMALMTSFQLDNQVDQMWSGIFAPSVSAEANTLDYIFIDNSTEGLDFIQGRVGEHPWGILQPRSFFEGFTQCAFFTSVDDGAELFVTDCRATFPFVCEVDNACNGLVVPEEWFCDPLLFNDGEICNCRCGAFDPDCETITPDIQPECGPGIACNAIGTCDLEVPPEWICPIETYNALDGCDCDCGAPDPDCDEDLVPDQRNKNCDGTCLEGVCLGFDIFNPTQVECVGNDAAFYFHTPLTFEEATDVCETFFSAIIGGRSDETIPSAISPIFGADDIAHFFSISEGFDLSTGFHVGIVAESDGVEPVFPENFDVLFPFNIFNNGSFVNQRQVGEFPWAANEPNELINGTVCTALGADGLLFDTRCDVKRQFICRFPTLCDEEQGGNPVGVTCRGTDLIAAGPTGVNYTFIGEECNEGGALVAVSSEDHLDAFNRILDQSPALLGLWAAIDAIELGSQSNPANFRFFEESEEGIEFVSNALRGQFPWDVNEPNDADGIEDCVIVDQVTGLLQDVSCSLEFPPVCRFFTNFCNGAEPIGITRAPTTASPTDSPTSSPTLSPTERVSTCTKRTFGITNPTKFF